MHANQQHKRLGRAVPPAVESRYEAQQLPAVVTSDIDPRAFDARQTSYNLPLFEIPVAPEFTRPSQEWVRQFLKDFAETRGHLARCAAPFSLVSIAVSFCLLVQSCMYSKI